ncbi:MAG: DUF3899 domain-containing protein [Clostridiales bacterium]|nr:DUF3899 domain-containing protein [Clostridiales bacterium]
MKSKKNERNLGTWVQYVSAIFVGLVIAVPVALLQGFSFGQAAYLNARYLSDGFFVAGMLIAGIGGMVWISSTGFFDIFSYGFHSILVLFSSLKNPKDHEKYYDYKTMREEKRGKPLYFLVIVGVLFLLLAVGCLALYYNLPA